MEHVGIPIPPVARNVGNLTSSVNFSRKSHAIRGIFALIINVNRWLISMFSRARRDRRLSSQ